MSIGAQSIDVVWDLPIALTEADRRAILSLARDAGIRDVARVSEPIRSPCPLVEVRSTPRVEGNRVSTDLVGIRRNTEVRTGRGAGRSGSGLILAVTVREGRVELHGARAWIA